MKKLRICIDALIQHDGGPGGVQQFIMGLASGISKLENDKEEYFFLTYSGADEWLKPYINENCNVINMPNSREKLKQGLKLKSILPALKILRNFAAQFLGLKTIFVPKSDGIIEKAGIDIMHFTHQTAFVTKIPNIYHPHDLQHLHLPQYFSLHTTRRREIIYRTFCEQAKIVAVASSWVKRDLIKNYNLSKNKIAIVPLAPPTESYHSPSKENLARIKNKFMLPDNFILYPAQTWPHKNHIGLLEALTILKNRDNLNISFVSCGRCNDFSLTLKNKVRESGLDNHVYFLDFVSPLDLQCLYKLARCVVIPTEFEAGSFPIWEAFLAGVPVACSNVTSLPEQAGDAALIFDPRRYDEIADAILLLWNNAELRGMLIEKGKKRVKQFSWEQTARIFRAYYRQLGNRNLTEEDISLLNRKPFM